MKLKYPKKNEPYIPLGLCSRLNQKVIFSVLIIFLVSLTPTYAQTSSISGFTLVNAETDEDIMPLQDGDELMLNMLPSSYLNIRANVSGENVGSVVFRFNDTDPFRIENVSPYAILGDTEGDYNGFVPPAGEHTITATPYSESGGKGEAGEPLTITFSVSIGMVTGFTLVNADTDEDIMPLQNGDVIHLNGLATKNLNIVAYIDSKNIGSVVFDLNDQQAFRTESFSPYALVGDTEGNFNGFTPPIGMHTVTATPYSESGGNGISGMSTSITFEVTDCDVNGGTVSTTMGDTLVYTCPGDGIDDIIEVMHETASNSNYGYVVTDEDLNVLGLPPGNQVNVEGAGVGICLVWGLSYTGNLTVNVGDNVGELAGLSDECWDLSDNYVKLVRDMPDGGTVSTTMGDTLVYTCPGDGIDDIIEVMHETASNSNYGYVVTDEDLNVLGLPPGNQVNVEGAGVGICLVWGLSYTGNLTVNVGDNVGELAGLSDECWDLSDNYVKLVRDMPDGGLVSTVSGDTLVNTCPGDGVDDIIEVMHLTNSNSNYGYVVTDEDLNVLGLPPGNQVNVEGAGVGICLVWGLSYTGNLTVNVGDNVGELAGLSDECWDLSDNYVKLVRDMPDGGTVSTTMGDTLVYTCPGDGIDDIIEVMHETASNSNYGYVVTDEDLNVLGLPPGNQVNVEGAGVGICLVWGLSYTGNLTVNVGDNVGELAGLSDECWDLSDNYVKLVRDMPDGGTVSTTMGDTLVYTCPGDGLDDIIEVMHETASNSNYGYVVTDEDLNVLGLPPGNQVNVEGAGVGICLVWGLSYTGNLTVNVGDNVGELAGLSDECWDLSDNYVKLVRDMPDGGTVSTTMGDTLVYTCPGDGLDDIIEVMHETASNSNYGYVVTDEDLNVLGLPPGNQVNVEGAGVGICLVWGLSYTGNLTVNVGDNVGELAGLSDECWDLSDNYVKLVRDMPDGGTVSTTMGDTLVYTCPGDGLDDIIEVMHETASNSNYGYVVTDEDLNVLGLPPGNQVNVEGAGVGICLVWGLSYTGNLTVNVGDNVGELAGLSDECWDLSDNYVKLVRDMPDGGLVSTVNGDTLVNTCPGDGVDDIIEVMHLTNSNSNYGYVVTDEALNVLGLPPGNQVNVEGAGVGTCLIWGLSYTGNLTVSVGDNVGELAGLSDDCWDLSDNFVTLLRDTANCSTSGISIENKVISRKSSVAAVFPNPFVESISIDLNNKFDDNQIEIIKIFNATGQQVLHQNVIDDFSNRNIKVDVRNLNLDKGIYFLNIYSQSGEIETFRILKE